MFFYLCYLYLIFFGIFLWAVGLETSDEPAVKIDIWKDP